MHSPVQVEQQVFRRLRVVALIPERRVRLHPAGLRPQLLLLRATPRCHDDGRRVLHLLGVLAAEAEEVRWLVLEGRQQTPRLDCKTKREGKKKKT